MNADRYEGLLTDEVLSRAMNELQSVADDLAVTSYEHGHAWLVECERRVDNALEDVTYVRDAFRRAQR